MALDNVFQQYGIKEVADVQFEALENDSNTGVTAGQIVLYLDTLKISTIETTAEQTEAKGGKGNPPLIIWDFGKEITVTLQDALFTQASLALLNNAVQPTTSTTASVRYTQEVTLTSTGAQLSYTPSLLTDVKYINFTKGLRGVATAVASTVAVSASLTSGDRVRFFYDIVPAGGSQTITIGPSSFPGTYKVIGDTVIRNANGTDVPYQFVIGKAKIGSETTITMEAEGDPTVFDMNLRVLRDRNKEMIKFIKYAFSA